MIGPSLIQGDAAYIPLTRGLFAKVDTADFEWLMQWKWFARRTTNDGPNVFYAARNIRTPRGQRAFFMHRAVLPVSEGFVVDHRDGDGLNNCRENLRPATPSQNAKNKRKRLCSTSTLLGVCWNKRSKRWVSQISCEGRKYPLGFYKSEEAAARAYDAASRELFGEFAVLNFSE